MKAKKIISLVMAALMLVGCSAMFISCKGSGNNGGETGNKIVISVEVYYVDNDGADAIFLKASELKVDAESSVNDALIALINERKGTYKALADGSVDSITFEGETLAQKSTTVSSSAESTTFKNTHFEWTVNGTTPEKETSLTCKVVDGDKVVYRLLTEEQTVTP